MNLEEYNRVKDMQYSDYCRYLQKKYGLASGSYMTERFTKSTKITRTKEGLFIHHIMEVNAPRLSNPTYAQKCPYKWQEPGYLVYCDWLEHLFLHILILNIEGAGTSGIGAFLLPELENVYLDEVPLQTWQIPCKERVINDKNVYDELKRRLPEDMRNPITLKQIQDKNREYTEKMERIKQEFNLSVGDNVRCSILSNSYVGTVVSVKEYKTDWKVEVILDGHKSPMTFWASHGRIEKIDETEFETIKNTPKTRPKLNFSVGDRIISPLYGKGTVVNISESSYGHNIMVQFDNEKQPKSFTSLRTPFERIDD